MPWIESLRGKEVVISGDFRADSQKTKVEMRRLALEAGASHAGEDVRSTTDVFVRGTSRRYKYGSFGDKEATLAHRAPGAVVIDGAGFFALLNGEAAFAVAPNAVMEPIPRPLGLPFVARDPETMAVAGAIFSRDPDVVDRGLRGHQRTLNLLAELVVGAGRQPLRPLSISCDFDLAWEDESRIFVCEVKSLRPENERVQLRLGLGQVLDYSDLLASTGKDVIAILAVEEPPTDGRWLEICRRSNVRLVWPATMPALFAER